jgi:hypothetical protein
MVGKNEAILTQGPAKGKSRAALCPDASPEFRWTGPDSTGSWGSRFPTVRALAERMKGGGQASPQSVRPVGFDSWEVLVPGVLFPGSNAREAELMQ